MSPVIFVSLLICIISITTLTRSVKISDVNSQTSSQTHTQNTDTADSSNIVYHLLLKGGNHYIGITSNLNRRWKQHTTNKGSKWTKIHKPLKMVEVWQDGTLELENKITYELMNKYGVTNVRGGDCHCPILKECKQFGCNYSDEISELDKIIGLLNEDWVREIISLEKSNLNNPSERLTPESVDVISNNIIKKNGNWYYNSDGDLYIITYKLDIHHGYLLEPGRCSVNKICFRMISEYLLQIYKWENGTPWSERLRYPEMFAYYMYIKGINK